MAIQRKKNPLVNKAAAQKKLQFTMMSRLAKALSNEFTLQDIFKLGYRNKEDVSNLPAYTLVVGSQNVLTNAAEQVGIRNGYQYDGPAGNQNTYGIDSNYDFVTHSLAGTQNLRKWGQNLEMRYYNPSTKTVSWLNLIGTLNTGNVCNFTQFWNGTKSVCLFVNGDLKIYQWSGASASYASSTSNSITVSGSNSLASLNFDTAGNIVVDGVTYAYTSAGLISDNIYSQSPTNNKESMSSQWNSQSFTTGATASEILTATVTINMASVLIPSETTANFIAALYTDNTGVPGTLIAKQIGSIPAAFSAGDFSVVFTFNQAVNSATTYHLVTYLLSSDGIAVFSNYTGNTPADGTNFSTNGGVTWSPQNGPMNAIIAENDSSLQTFNGISPTPSGITVGDPIVQPPIVATTAVTGISGYTSFDLIATIPGRNSVLYGSFTSNTVYLTKTNSFTDTTFTSPVRVAGEGALAVLYEPPTAFIGQTDSGVSFGGMYISGGKSNWYGIQFTLSSDNSKEAFNIAPLQTSSGQGAFAQSYVAKFKNSVVYISNEVLFNSFGLVKDIFTTPQVVNMSDPIKYDIDAYTFGGGSVHYFNYFIYFSVPKNGVVRIYNVNKKYWEAPQTMPIGMFYEVNGELYGHDATTNASYQLFVPNSYNDVGGPINAIAAFPYVSGEGAKPNQKKFFNKFYTEGYIAGNTTLTLEINYDFGAFSGTYSVGNSGANKAIIFNKITDGSLGKNPLGSQPIGTILNLPQISPIPKFRVVNTFTPVNNFEYQVVYSSYDVDQNWLLLRFGPGIGPSRDLGNEIIE